MIVLDTHVLLWLDAASARLGVRARKSIDGAFQKGECAVSSIVFWEVGMLLNKDRIQLAMDPSVWRSDLLNQGLVEFPVTGEIGINAATITGFVGDPADRLIAATALQHGATLYTADKSLLGSSMPASVVDAAQ